MNNSDDKSIQERDLFPALLKIYQEAFSILGEFCQEDELCERLYQLRGKVFDLMVELGYEERLSQSMALQNKKNRNEQATFGLFFNKKFQYVRNFCKGRYRCFRCLYG